MAIQLMEGFFMVSQKVVIKNPTGLHLRPAGILCREAMEYSSLITFTFRNNTANAKSVLSVLGACVKCGDEIELCCDGTDEKEALAKLVKLIEDGLGE
jgi:phosphocarrier protein